MWVQNYCFWYNEHDVRSQIGGMRFGNYRVSQWKKVCSVRSKVAETQYILNRNWASFLRSPERILVATDDRVLFAWSWLSCMFVATLILHARLGKNFWACTWWDSFPWTKILYIFLFLFAARELFIYLHMNTLSLPGQVEAQTFQSSLSSFWLSSEESCAFVSTLSLPHRADIRVAVIRSKRCRWELYDRLVQSNGRVQL